MAQKCDFIQNKTFVTANQIDSNIKDKSFGFVLVALVVYNYHCVFVLLNRYTSVQTNVNSNKTKKGIIQSQTKSKASLPNYVFEIRQAKKYNKSLEYAQTKGEGNYKPTYI